MSKGLEALESLETEYYTENGERILEFHANDERLDIIEKELKALDIINNKEVNMIRFRAVFMLNGNADEYNKSEDYKSRHLTQEEFKLLKEVLKCKN